MPRCPICEAATDATAKTFPFCSERCRLIDLGNWLGENYRVPGDPAPDAPGSRHDDQEED